MGIVAKIILWFAFIALGFITITEVIDMVYEKSYYSKQTPEKQAEIDAWLKNDTLFFNHTLKF